MRTVLFGLDGATYSVLDPLMERGVMPHLKRLRDTGVRCQLESTPLPITPQAWTTLATGRSMGHHGIHDFVRVERTDSGVFLRFNTGRDRQTPTVWKYLSEQGKRVTALNYYGLAPSEPVNGHTMPGFVPGRYLKRSSYPADLFSRLERVPHFDVSVLGLDLDIEREGLADMPPERWFEWIGLHIERERAWFSALEYLMLEEPTDLAAIVFDGVDKIQHLAYRYLDPQCIPEHPSAWEQQVIDLCDQYFVQIDNFLGRALEIVGDTGRVFIASDHGFTACHEIVYVNKYLHDLGYLTWSGDVPEDEQESIVVDRLTKHMGVYDWERTRAAALTPSCNGVYILDVPPAEYDAFREKLIAELYALRGADGGQVITEIKKREDWFAGPWMHRAPDLTLTMRDHGFLSVLNAAHPVAQRTAPVGTHHPLGVLWGVGPGLKRGVTVDQCNILDMASLLVHSVGEEIPAEYEGKFPVNLYEESYLASDPPRIAWRKAEAAAQPAVAEAPRDAMDEEEELVLARRLRSLGYIE